MELKRLLVLAIAVGLAGCAEEAAIEPSLAPPPAASAVTAETAGLVEPTSALAATPAGMPDTGAADQVRALPGLGPVETPQFAGYASVNEAACGTLSCDGAGEAGLFYWFVSAEDDPGAKPTILWTNGGPGSTSFWGFFTENGPYSVTDQKTLEPRPAAWNETANYLIFDHPLGVGLSFADADQLPANVQAGVDQWYQALLHFLARHPEVAEQPIVLAGESYGGTYVPLLAKAILDGNAKAGKELVKLAGTVLLAAWVDPLLQQGMDTTYAESHGMITAADKARLDAIYARCKAAIEATTPSSKAANDLCSQIKSGIEAISGLYMLNIAEAGDPPTGPVTDYLNDPAVREAIHARPGGSFSFFSQPIGDRYVVGEQDSYRPLVQELLEGGLPTIVIAGLNDAADVNFLGTQAWLDALEGAQAEAFRAAPTTQWKVAGSDRVLGYLQQGGGLTWLKVLNAGHLAVMDQPRLLDVIMDTLLPSG